MSEGGDGAFLIEDGDGEIRVGFKRGDYDGPVARVCVEGQWLYVVTDDYEGAAMLNIETLPELRRALDIIAERLEQSSSAEPS